MTVIRPVDAPAHRSRRGLAVFIGVAGVVHFVAPRLYDALIPAWLPGSSRGWVYGSGVAELACAALLARPATARAGALATAATLVAVFPGNIKMAADYWPPDGAVGWGSLARLPLQVPMIAWALSVARAEARRAPSGPGPSPR